MIASTVTESNAQDPSQAPELLTQIAREIDRVIGDGLYDQAPVYTAVEHHAREPG